MNRPLDQCHFNPPLIGIVDKVLASHSGVQGSNPADSRGLAGGLASPVILVYGWLTRLYGGAFAFYPWWGLDVNLKRGATCWGVYVPP